MGRYITDEATLRRCAGRTTALYSGSFNPPHPGHLALMEAVLARGLVEQVLVFPHSLNVAKQSELVAIGHRVAMLRLLLDGSPRTAALHICAPGFCQGFRDRIDYLAGCLGGEHLLAILIGSDSLARADYPRSLLRLRHLVHCRDDGAAPVLPAALSPDSVCLAGIPCLSSSEIRRLPSEWDVLLGAAVAGYIRAHGLYGR